MPSLMYTFDSKDDEWYKAGPGDRIDIEGTETMETVVQVVGIVVIIIIVIMTIVFINRMIMKLFVWLIILLILALVGSFLAIVYLWNQLNIDI